MNNSFHLKSIVLCFLLLAFFAVPLVNAQQNPIQIENVLPGTTDWQSLIVQ